MKTKEHEDALQACRRCTMLRIQMLKDVPSDQDREQALLTVEALQLWLAATATAVALPKTQAPPAVRALRMAKKLRNAPKTQAAPLVRSMRTDFAPRELNASSTIARKMCGDRFAQRFWQITRSVILAALLTGVWLIGFILLHVAICDMLTVEFEVLGLLLMLPAIISLTLNLNTAVIFLMWDKNKFNLLYLAGNTLVFLVCLPLASTPATRVKAVLWSLSMLPSVAVTLFMDAAPSAVRRNVGIVFFILNIIGISVYIVMIRFELVQVEDRMYPMGPFDVSALNVATQSALTLLIFGVHNLAMLIRRPHYLVSLTSPIMNTKIRKDTLTGLIRSHILERDLNLEGPIRIAVDQAGSYGQPISIDIEQSAGLMLEPKF